MKTNNDLDKQNIINIFVPILGDNTLSNLKLFIQAIYINNKKKIVTIVFKDGTHQIVKCSPEDSFDIEIGFALALTRKIFGSKTQTRKYINKNAIVINKTNVQLKKETNVKKVIKESVKEKK